MRLKCSALQLKWQISTILEPITLDITQVLSDFTTFDQLASIFRLKITLFWRWAVQHPDWRQINTVYRIGEIGGNYYTRFLDAQNQYFNSQFDAVALKLLLWLMLSSAKDVHVLNLVEISGSVTEYKCSHRRFLWNPFNFSDNFIGVTDSSSLRKCTL